MNLKSQGLRERYYPIEQEPSVLNVLGNLLLIIAFILFVDFAFFIMWALSGQVPADGFYLGAISTEVIRFLVF